MTGSGNRQAATAAGASRGGGQTAAPVAHPVHPSAAASEPVGPAAPGGNPRLELRWIRAGDLADNPRNWRLHPPGQMDALRHVLADPAVGWAGALLYNETTGHLIDGHARKRALHADALMPVLVGRWSLAAEKKILATLDPLAGMAGVKPEALESLLADLGEDLDDEAFASLLSSLDADLARAKGDEPPPSEPSGYGSGSGSGQGPAESPVKCPKCGHRFVPGAD